MNGPVWLLVAAAVLVAVALVLLFAWSRWRSRRLRRDFGPEYEHTVAATGDRRRAEDELEARRERVAKLELRTLDAEERRDLTARWEAIQQRFVDRPAEAVSEADRLIAAAMRAVGYPLDDVADATRRQEDLSVAHPDRVARYREGAAIAVRSRRGDATTEELRRAMVHFREVFEELVGAPVAADHGGHAAATAPRRAAS